MIFVALMALFVVLFLLEGFVYYRKHRKRGRHRASRWNREKGSWTGQ